ncbi:hypothetical protein PN488_02805 [Nodularia spumigena CS-591/12]|uniref:hypothetical protein n=1 Tax=Nodularia spumigena TaxID=70799 RepID=UPI00232A7FD2|nr:hypothetical protein [Nodularia spumigena]MDB9303318.1 hypothetical protein [Nodularia spumigena CS-591/12]MDB9347603.1 hypothetical protein [Nodularia spumigena CS-588/01]MDB9353817.1 hypothetical protein [Nodularia spumigena CS-588/05]
MQAPLLAFAWAGLAEVGLASVGLILIYRYEFKAKGNNKYDLVYNPILGIAMYILNSFLDTSSLA